MRLKGFRDTRRTGRQVGLRGQNASSLLLEVAEARKAGLRKVKCAAVQRSFPSLLSSNAMQCVVPFQSRSRKQRMLIISDQ